MEKFKHRTKQYKRIGLLVFLFVLATQNLFAYTWNSLRVKPEKDYCFSGEVCVFKLEIPGVLPSRVEFTVQSIPNNVTLLSSEKEEYLKEGERGTVVSFKIKFSKSGTYTLPKIAAHVDWTWSTIPFEPITVYENPMLLTPELSAELPETMELGESYTFTIYGKYFLEIVSVNSELNPTFILKQTNVFVDLPYLTSGFSTENVPIAEYQITPIDVGTFSLPKISVHGRAYSEASANIELSTKKMKITMPTEKQDEQTENGSFSESLKAFESENIDLATDDTELINSVLETETKKHQIHKAVLHTLGTLLLISFVVLIIGIVIKQTKLKLISVICLLLFLTFFVTLNVFYSARFCVCVSCKVNIIPEQNANSVMQLTAGTKVKIIDETSDWFFIETADKRNGWILKSNGLLIKN